MAKRSFITKKDFALISTLGIEFALIMCIGAFGGLWCDKKLNTSPWFILIGSMLAFAFALFVLVSHAKAATSREQTTKTEIKR